MQQPPPGRRPGTPYTPPGAGYPSTPSAPRQPAGGYPAHAAPYVPPMPVRKKRGGLKFLAGTCIFSAWLTLVVSILGAIGAFTSGAGLAQMAAVIPAAVPLPSSPGSGALPGGSDGLGGSGDEGLGLPSSGLGVPGMPGAGGANPLASMLSTFLPALCFAGGVFTLVTGIVTFLIFLGLGQACYALLDLEEQTFQISQTLQLVLARLGVGR